MDQTNRQIARGKIRDKEVSMAALCDAAESLFAKHGFAGTTLDMLVKKSGVNRAMVSYYFGSKTGLYEAVIENLVGDVMEYVSDHVDSSSELETEFHSYVEALCLAFCARPTFPAILLREYMGGHNQERPGPFAQVIQFYRRTQALYHRGFALKKFCKMDPHQLHLSLIGPLIFFAVTQRFRANAIPRLSTDLSNPAAAAFASHHATLLWKGLTAN